MNERNTFVLPIVCIVLVIWIFTPSSIAEILYVDSRDGNDTNPGTKGKPLRTIARAAAIVNDSKEPGPTTIQVTPGIYIIDEMVTFENERSYSRDARPRGYLHVVPGTLGCELGAGLLKKETKVQE